MYCWSEVGFRDAPEPAAPGRALDCEEENRDRDENEQKSRRNPE
jgi:hypothetical protein